MEDSQKNIEKHLFICTQKREHGECCFNRGAIELFQELKTKRKTDPSWKGKVSVSQSSCLGFCSQGIAAVIYPEKKWITKIESNEAQELAQKVDTE